MINHPITFRAILWVSSCLFKEKHRWSSWKLETALLRKWNKIMFHLMHAVNICMGGRYSVSIKYRLASDWTKQWRGIPEPQTLVRQQWDSVMIPRVWLFVNSVLFKTAANSFQYKYLLIAVPLWLVSGPGCEGNKSSQRRWTFARIALPLCLSSESPWILCLLSHVHPLHRRSDIVFMTVTLYPHQFLQHLVFSGCFDGWMEGWSGL